ncbi:MAG: hypothetical protein HYX40_11305 [Sphingobacteriales bacterium]|nr:hypothetical protein [Sphingobacteriales bacterium]
MKSYKVNSHGKYARLGKLCNGLLLLAFIALVLNLVWASLFYTIVDLVEPDRTLSVKKIRVTLSATSLTCCNECRVIIKIQ